MKKVVAIFICSLILCGLVACKNNEDFLHTELKNILDYTYNDEKNGTTHTIRIYKRESSSKYISQYRFEAIENKDTEEEIVYIYSTPKYKNDAPKNLEEFIKSDKNLAKIGLYTKICDYTKAYNAQIWIEGFNTFADYVIATLPDKAAEKIGQLNGNFLDYIQEKTNASPGDASVATAEFFQSEVYKLAGLDWINTGLDVVKTAEEMVNDVNVLKKGITDFVEFLSPLTKELDGMIGREQETSFERKKADLRAETINEAKELYNAIKNIGDKQENTLNSPTDSYSSPADSSFPQSDFYTNTYTTNRHKNQSIKYPVFTLNYSDNWKISQEELGADYERSAIKNERGVTVEYWQNDIGFGSPYYGGGYTLSYAKITKVADSSFKPRFIQEVDSSALGNFVVVKLEEYAIEDGLNSNGPYKVDGLVVYAIVPESYLGDGETSFKGLGYISLLSWEYFSPTVVLATSPDNTFTSQEEQEIIYMLSSFRETSEIDTPPENQTNSNKVVGINSNGNLVNGGELVGYDGYIYCAFNGRIYKIKEDGSEKQEIYKFKSEHIKESCLNIADEWLYFYDSQSVLNLELWKIRTNGKDLTYVCDAPKGGAFYIINGYIYFDSDYRLKIGDKFPVPTYDRSVASGYTTNFVDGFVYSYDKKIYKITMDGTDRTMLFDGRADYMLVDDGWVYFQNQNSLYDSLYRMKTDGSELQKMLGEDVTHVISLDEWLYCNISIDGERGLYKVKKDGSEYTFLADIGRTNPIYIVDKWLYYYRKSEEKIYRINIDSSELQEFLKAEG